MEVTTVKTEDRKEEPAKKVQPLPDKAREIYRKMMATGRGLMGFKGYWRAMDKSDEEIEGWLGLLRAEGV